MGTGDVGVTSRHEISDPPIVLPATSRKSKLVKSVEQSDCVTRERLSFNRCQSKVQSGNANKPFMVAMSTFARGELLPLNPLPYFDKPANLFCAVG
jgi:hypothetical protein